MSLWNKLNHSTLSHFSNHFKRFYFRPSYVSSLCNLPKTPNLSLLHHPCGIHRTPEFPHNIRFFASFGRLNSSDGPRMNQDINARFIRLVTDEGHTVVSTGEALERARRLKLDLVEVQRDADPPVCKIMDFNKEKYKQKLKEKERAKSKADVTLKKGGECKEIRFSGKTEHKDLKMKADMVKRLMEQGYRVKCVVLAPKKKESRKPSAKKLSSDDESAEVLGDDEDALQRREQEEFEKEMKGVLSQLTTLIEDVAIFVSEPRVEKRQAYVIVKHVKFGESKKGAKKLKDDRKKNETEVAVESGDESEGPLSGEEKDVPGEYEYAGRTPLSTDLTNGTKMRAINFVKNDAQAQADDRNFNRSNASHLGPVHGSTRAETVPASAQKLVEEPENRYKRAQPRPGPQISRDGRPSDRRDSFRYDQQFSGERRDSFRYDQQFSGERRDSFRYDQQLSGERRETRGQTNVYPPTGERRDSGNYNFDRGNSNIRPDESHKPDEERTTPSYGIFSSQNRNSPSSAKEDVISPGSKAENVPRKWGLFSRDNAGSTASKPN